MRVDGARWLTGLALGAALGLTGCQPPENKVSVAAPTVSTTSATAVSPAPLPRASETPVVFSSPQSSPLPSGESTDRTALENDFENAEGMPGYDEVLPLQIPPLNAKMLAQGKQLFSNSCAGCHGQSGVGDGPAGKNLDPPPRDLTKSREYKYGHLELALYRTGAYGIPDTGMTGWGEVLDADELWAVTHYLRTLQK